MTDTPPVPPTPETPAPPPAASAPPAAPAAPGAPVVAGPKQTLSIIGFILGIGSIVFALWGALIGLAAGIAGIIVARKAKKDEPGAPAWMHTLGVVLSIVGIALSVVGFIIFIAVTIIPLIAAATYQVS